MNKKPVIAARDPPVAFLKAALIAEDPHERTGALSAEFAYARRLGVPALDVLFARLAAVEIPLFILYAALADPLLAAEAFGFVVGHIRKA